MTRRKLKLYLVAPFLVLGLWIVMLGFVPYYIDQMEEMETVGLASIDRAIIAGDLAAVTYWLEKGVDANSSCGYMLAILINGSTPLMVALNSSYSYSPSPPSPPSPEIVSLLIENGADVNSIDNGGKTPLMDALDNRWTGYPHNPEVVSLLLDAGAEVNACNDNGWTPLMYASRSCCPKPEIIMLLLDEGADPLAINKLGLKAFFYLRLNDELQDTEAYKKLQASSFK